ncbi:pseudouridine synthase RluA family [Perkinsela sp. CCAP 1560/4]|nr:pseudouridine synthase RluA family [Perkinsela sp. CCAP 1560/4]|eukprot:KNH06331.1 pseudouridine synthase RluA family [Perkinsela sp. CCAP 1560/4]
MKMLLQKAQGSVFPLVQRVCCVKNARTGFEMQLQYVRAILRGKSAQMDSCGKLALSSDQFKKLLPLCTQWNEVVSWLGVCNLTCGIEKGPARELLSWSIQNADCTGIEWSLTRWGCKAEPYQLTAKESKRLVEIVCVSGEIRLRRHVYYLLLTRTIHILVDHGVKDSTEREDVQSPLQMFRRNHDSVSTLLGPQSVALSASGVIRMLFRVMGTLPIEHQAYHRLFGACMRWALASDNPERLSYVFTEKLTVKDLSPHTRRIMANILNHSSLCTDDRPKYEIDKTCVSANEPNFNFRLLMQYAYLVCENDSVFHLRTTYGYLCAQTILPWAVIGHLDTMTGPNVESMYELCCLCSINSLPECIIVINRILQTLWRKRNEHTGDMKVEPFRKDIQRMFPKLSKKLYPMKDDFNGFIAHIVRAFILAASAEYISPKDIEGWLIERDRKPPLDAHTAIFDAVPAVQIPPFFGSVDDFRLILGPKLSLLISSGEKVSGQPLLTRLSTGSFQVRLSQVIFHTRFGLPPFLWKVFDPIMGKNCLSLDSVLYENAQVAILYKSSGTNIAPTSKAYHEQCAQLANQTMDREGKKIRQQLSQIPHYGIIHRIDNEVSGVVVIAKTCDSYHFCKNIFFQSLAKLLHRRYIAIVHFHRRGDFSNTSDAGSDGTMDEHIHALSFRSSMSVRPVKFSGPFALVRIELFHGMKHAIRRMISDPSLPLSTDERSSRKNHRNCVILGETLYGPPSAGSTPLINRLALHAESVGFPLGDGQVTGSDQIRVDASMPQDMVRAWERICAVYAPQREIL